MYKTLGEDTTEIEHIFHISYFNVLLTLFFKMEENVILKATFIRGVCVCVCTFTCVHKCVTVIDEKFLRASECGYNWYYWV